MSSEQRTERGLGRLLRVAQVGARVVGAVAAGVDEGLAQHVAAASASDEVSSVRRRWCLVGGLRESTEGRLSSAGSAMPRPSVYVFRRLPRLPVKSGLPVSPAWRS